jgi:hypothetical protein
MVSFNPQSYLPATGTATIVAVVTIVVLLIIVMVGVAAARARHRDYYSGVWSASPEFLAESNLSNFVLYLTPKKAGDSVANNCYDGYIVIADTAGELVANYSLEMHVPRLGVVRGLRVLLGCRKSVKAKAEFKFDGNGKAVAAPFDAHPTLALTIADGSLTIFNDKKVFAHLYKDNAETFAAAAV